MACSGETGIANAFPYGEPSKWLVAGCHRLPLRPGVLAGIGTKRRISLTRLAICGAPCGAPIGRSGLTRQVFLLRVRLLCHRGRREVKRHEKSIVAALSLLLMAYLYQKRILNL